MKKLFNEHGEIMIEGTIVMVFTLMLLAWILAVGFLYYQKYVMTTATNDVAAKIAETYYNTSGDLMMGYIPPEKLASRELYRTLDDNLIAVNEKRAQRYIEYALKRINFTGVVGDTRVSLKHVSDSPIRSHIVVTATCEFKTPFGFALQYFGLRHKNTYQCVSRAECTDIINYIDSSDFLEYHLSGDFLNSRFNDLIQKMIEVFSEKYN